MDCCFHGTLEQRTLEVVFLHTSLTMIVHCLKFTFIQNVTFPHKFPIPQIARRLSRMHYEPRKNT